MAGTLETMGFSRTLADNDVWLRASINSKNKRYYEYVLVYVDDILVTSHDPKKVMDGIGSVYRLKEEPSIQNIYLGSNIKEWRYPNSVNVRCCGMSSYKYVNDAIKVVEMELIKVNKILKSKVSTPMDTRYRPELDMSPELDAEKHH